jgi:hypothetical protein
MHDLRERPIIFSGDMVRKILAGEKTQTRQVIKPQPFSVVKDHSGCELLLSDGKAIRWPFAEGQKLWVQEKYRLVDFEYVDEDWNASVEYTDGVRGPRLHYLRHGADEKTGWRSSAHMPRKASRITLEVTDVRVERLKNISTEDCRLEGIDEPYIASETGYETQMRGGFCDLWDSINAQHGFGWDANPWVFKISFKVVG